MYQYDHVWLGSRSVWLPEDGATEDSILGLNRVQAYGQAIWAGLFQMQLLEQMEG